MVPKSAVPFLNEKGRRFFGPCKDQQTGAGIFGYIFEIFCVPFSGKLRFKKGTFLISSVNQAKPGVQILSATRKRPLASFLFSLFFCA